MIVSGRRSGIYRSAESVRRIIYAVQPVANRGCGTFYFYFTYLTSPVLALDVSSHFFIYSVCNKRFNEKLAQKWKRLVSGAKVASADQAPQPPSGAADTPGEPRAPTLGNVAPLPIYGAA